MSLQHLILSLMCISAQSSITSHAVPNTRGAGMFDVAELNFDTTNHPYFDDIRNLYPYTPIRRIIMCQAFQDPTTSSLPSPTFDFPKGFNNFTFPTTEKSSRPNAIFITLEHSPNRTIEGYLQCEHQIYHASRLPRQHFIDSRYGD